jgi:hypothetical protein
MAMKKLLLITLLLPVLCFSCKKIVFSPEGPTDVRIRNLSGSALTEVVVRIKDEEIGFGTIDKSNVSEYHRFKTAFPKACISAKIDLDTISTGPVDFTYMNYFGQVRLTYDVIIENSRLKINNVTLDSALELK